MVCLWTHENMVTEAELKLIPLSLSLQQAGQVCSFSSGAELGKVQSSMQRRG